MINDPMRNHKNGSRQMTEEELDDFLNHKLRYGTMAYPNEGGWPDMRVLNFGYLNGAYYFHANKITGEKLRHFTDGMQVSLSFFTPSDTVGLRRWCQHDSVLVYGRLYRIDSLENNEQEIWDALTKLCLDGGPPHKCQHDWLSKIYKTCAVFKVVPEYTVGKLTIFTSLPEKTYLESILPFKK